VRFGPPGTVLGSSCIGWQAEPDLCEQLPELSGLLEVETVTSKTASAGRPIAAVLRKVVIAISRC
jgi:hypothetical protein